jgi:elongation of very long chain fatty acids protein 4
MNAVIKAVLVKPSQVFVGLALVAVELFILERVQESAEDIIQTSEGKDNPYASCSVYIPIAFTSLYLLGVYFGQKYFESREAWNVEGYMLVYNFYQTAFNIWAVHGFLKEVYQRGLPFGGTFYRPGREEARLGFLIYCHYQNKYIELLDTVFMVVRKKNEQVSFLHVYHHSIMSWAWLIVLLVNPGGDAYFGSLMNSIIHTVMYGYYLLSALKLPCPWKKYVTALQLAQFAVIFVQGWYAIYLGSTPTWLTLIQQFVMTSMLVLFSQFYSKEYAGGKKKSKKSADPSKGDDVIAENDAKAVTGKIA